MIGKGGESCARTVPFDFPASGSPAPLLMFEVPSPRRLLLQSAARVFGEADEVAPTSTDAPPRLTPSLLRTPRMSRNRDRVLANLDEMYREAFERAKTTADEGQMATLDFAYRREQLYFEILLDIRDAVERRG